MKDTARDELELKLHMTVVTDLGTIPPEVLEVLKEALNYVIINPSINAVSEEMYRLEDDGYVDDDDDDGYPLTNADYRVALAVMGKHS